jgi:outer membrane murein-binding lipoprotein Lpp
MRLAAVIALLALTGCKSTPKVEPLPVQPPAPTKESVVKNLGKDMDKTDHRVASALVAIEKNADKPKVVVAESRLAQSYLPEPPAGDVAFAMARATKSDPLDYKKQMEFGRQLATAVNKAWEKLEADQKEAARVSGLKDARIKELTEEVARVKQEASQNIWTLTGAALFVAGALATAFVGPRIGIPLLACAALAGAVPFIYDSPYFLWWVWDKVRDSVNSSNGKRD